MVIEIGRKWAFTAYIVISILSIFILPDKETAMMFVGFFGYFPVLKSMIEQKLNKVVGMPMNLAMEDLISEEFVEVVKKYRYPKVDFGTLKALVCAKVRAQLIK